MRGPSIVVFLAIAFLLPPSPAWGQVRAAGETTEQVVSTYDPGQSYAVYLPSAYDPGREWPLLVTMDPRGRALVPLERFRHAAERFGYIVISSYNTRSDVDYDANTPALNAILNDAVRTFSIDRDRIYLAGLSGTARRGWSFAYRVPGGVAGLIGFGAGLPTGSSVPNEVPFAFFGSAGTTDYNYEEMVELARSLDRHRVRNRFLAFDGPHEWGDPATCLEALGWMELQAMRAGLRLVDWELIAELHAERTREAEDRMASGDLYGAYLVYDSVVQDFSGLQDVAEAQRITAELREGDSVRRSIDTAARLLAADRAFREQLARFFQRMQSSTSAPPTVGEALVELRIKDLQVRAANAEKPLEAKNAQRHLEKIFVNTVFYGPRDLLQRREPFRALVMLRIAEAIKPDDREVIIGLARAHAQLANHVEAMEALARLEQLRALDAESIEADPYLQPLRELPEFRALQERLRNQ